MKIDKQTQLLFSNTINIIVLDLHTITLNLVKGAYDACGSNLMSDKKNFDNSFSYDGPG